MTTSTRPAVDAVLPRAACLTYVALGALHELAAMPAFDGVLDLPPDEREALRASAAPMMEANLERLRRSGLWERMTPVEQAFYTTPLLDKGPGQLMVLAHRAESAGVLLWAIGLLDTLGAPDALTPPESLMVLQQEGRTCMLRDASVIDRERTIAEMWLWRARTEGLRRSGHPLPPDARTTSWDEIVRRSAESAVVEGLVPRQADGDFVVFGRPYRDVSPQQWSQLHLVAEFRLWAFNWLCGMAPDGDWERTPLGT